MGDGTSVCVHMEARGWSWALYPITLHLIFEEGSFDVRGGHWISQRISIIIGSVLLSAAFIRMWQSAAFAGRLDPLSFSWCMCVCVRECMCAHVCTRVLVCACVIESLWIITLALPWKWLQGSFYFFSNWEMKSACPVLAVQPDKDFLEASLSERGAGDMFPRFFR